MTTRVDVERGSKRTFVCAQDWPGWCRSGRDEDDALTILADYGPRYLEVLDGAGVRMPAAKRPVFDVDQRVRGNATTDFGAPDGVFDSDERPMSGPGLERMTAILDASWAAFDRAVKGARGRALRKGPRGGGRDLGAIADHVVNAEVSYSRRLGASLSADGKDPWDARIAERRAVRAALAGAVRGEFPPTGPRGGQRWVPRRFLRRAVWHVLDHAWEIEDRVGG